MAGKDGSRGYTFQTIVAMIESLELGYEDWDEIKVEPNTELDKVDIQFYSKDKAWKAIQVKSSINRFQKEKVERWLADLKNDASGAESVTLCLVGDDFSNIREMIGKTPEIELQPFEELQTKCKGKLVDYIVSKGLENKTRVSDVITIYERFFYTLHTNCLVDKRIGRNKFEKIFQDVLQGYDSGNPKGERNVNRLASEITKGCKNPVMHFLGREHDIQAIMSILHENKELGRKNTLWIYGMGGMGKTQLCRYLYFELRKEYSFIGWITYQDNFMYSLVRSIQNIDKTGELEKDYSNAILYLNKLEGRVVLFIDNYDTKDNYLYDIEQLQCDMIITSRGVNPDTFCGYRLDFLSLTDCKRLFRTFYTIEESTSMNEIIHKAGYLTLAVELVAKTGQKLGISLVEFLKKLEEKGFDIGTVITSNWDNSGKRLNVALAKHFGIVFDLTDIKTDVESVYILNNMCLLPYLGVSQIELINWLKLNEENNRLKDLFDWGWIQKTSDQEYLMHPIISFTIRRESCPCLSDCSNLINALSEIIRIKEGSSYIETFKYLPYASSVGKYFSQHKNERNDICVLTLCLRLADLNRLNGDYDEAYAWGIFVSGIVETERNTDEIINIKNIVYNILSEICLDMRNKNRECLEWAQRAEKNLNEGNGILDVMSASNTYHNLACAYIQLGDNKKALMWEKKAEESRENYCLHDDVRMLNIYRNMAMIHRRMGDVKKAYEYQQYVIRTLELMYRDEANNPSFPVSYSLFSFILIDMGKIDEAIEYQKKAVVVRERNNINDPKLAINYNNMGMFYLKKGDLNEAVKWQKKAIRLDSKYRGRYHIDVATDYYNYAIMLEALGKYDKALKCLYISEKIEMRYESERKQELIEIRQKIKHIKEQVNK